MKHYKSTRRFKCPYCDYRDTRENLVDHVDRKHSDMIPSGHTAAREVYQAVNNKDHGTCMICRGRIEEWDEKLWKYKNICSNPKCREEVRKRALENHIKVYNKSTLLADPDHQEKMLANRKISGSYKFSDGGSHTYTGQYERKALEFMDKVMEIPSDDIQSPGPVLEYEFEGKAHSWITDIYYIPANLVIEIKDGGSNPNNRSMESYRDKQIAKEVMITECGNYNYLRLTNNSFDQLLLILAELKEEMMDEDYYSATHIDRAHKIHINEEVGGMPPQNAPSAYIIPYGFRGMNDNDIDGYALAGIDGINKKYMISIGDDLQLKMFKEDLLEGRKFSMYKVTLTKEVFAKVNNATRLLNEHKISGIRKDFLLHAVSKHSIMSPSDIDFLPEFKKVDCDGYISETYVDDTLQELSSLYKEYKVLKDGEINE